MLQTFAQTQAIRLYYSFYDVATDRYHLADGYHQVMLSARELSNELPAAAQTWVNQYLQFTHGYGLVMNFVSKTVGGGFPQYLLENVPTQSAFGLKIDQPSVYYGESMPGYRIVDTDIKEFDYPKGNDNVYTSYAGTGGIPLDSLWKLVLFAWNKSDINILFTNYLKPESRIQIHRDVRERVAQIAPFLRLDSDPYPVLSEGKLFWIQDAYTGSSYFPYSNPQATEPFVARNRANSTFGPDSLGARFSQAAQSADVAAPVLDGLNYVRNSVKVVVDMYNGDVNFYVMDPKDPILSVYRRAFPGDIFAIQDDISNEISGKLRLRLTRAEKKRLTKRQTDDAEAYRLYLKGRHHWNRWTEDGFYKAIEYFQQAVEKDPTYALAYSGLADSYVLLGWNSYLLPKDAYPKGKAAAMEALRLDPDLGEAHTPLAAGLWLHDWQWQKAQIEFKRSLALNPVYPTANHWYAEYVMTMGRHQEAIARMRKSQELDPLSLIISVAIGWSLYMALRYDEAIEQLRRTVELDPNYPVTYWVLGLLLRKMGRYEQAIAEGEKAVNLSGGSPLMRAALAQTFGAAGMKNKAIEIHDDLAKLAKQKYVAPYFFAGIQVGLGEDDRAIECLEKSYKEHSHWLIYLHMDPSMDSLRSNPRFNDLLNRVGLPLPPPIPA